MDHPGPQGFQLAPQLLEVNFQGIGTRVETFIPDVLVDLLARENLGGMPEKVRQQGQFLGREVERAATTLGALRGQVNDEITLAKSQARWPLTAADQGANAG